MRTKNKYKREDAKKSARAKAGLEKLDKMYPNIKRHYDELATRNTEFLNKLDTTPTTDQYTLYVRNYESLFTSTDNIAILEEFKPDDPLLEGIRRTNDRTRRRMAELAAVYTAYFNAKARINAQAQPVGNLTAEDRVRAMREAGNEIKSMLDAAEAEYSTRHKKIADELDLTDELTDPINYTGSGTKPITSPLQDPNPTKGEANWEPQEGTAKVNKFGLLYGLGLGYLKDIGGHAFAGGEVYAMKSTIKLDYKLLFDSEPNRSFGEVRIRPGITFGFSLLAGKALNPRFGFYVRSGVEMTQTKFEIDANNDRPPIGVPQKTLETKEISLTPVYAGVGVMFKASKNILVRGELNILMYGETKARDFSKEGTDKRRRGYAMSGTAYRLVCVVSYLVGKK